MALGKGVVPLRFAGGIDTKPDPKSVPTTKLLALENGVFTRAISIVKRNGYTSLSRRIAAGTGTLTGAKRLATRDEAELLAFTRDRAYSHQPSIDQWIDAGAAISATASDRAAVRTGTEQTMPDHATSNGVTAYAWEDSLGGVWWSAVVAATGRVLVAPTQLHASGQRPRCVAVGDVIHVYYAVPTLRCVFVLRVNPSAPHAATSALVIEDLSSTNPAYDAEPTTRAGTPAVIAWIEHGSGFYRVGFVDVSGVLGSPASGHPSVYRSAARVRVAAPIAVAYRPGADPSSDELAVAYHDDGTGHGRVDFYGTDEDLFALAATQTANEESDEIVRIAAVFATTADDAGRYRLWTAWETAASEPSDHYTVTNYVTMAGANGDEQIVRSVGLASRAFRDPSGTDAYAVLVHDTTYFNTYVTLRLSDHAPAGRHLPGAAAGLPTRSHLSSAHEVGGAAAICLPYRERVQSEDGDKFQETGLRAIVIDFDHDDSHVAAQLGRGLYLAGACPLHYDGVRFVEQGFHVGPEKIEASSTDGAGDIEPGTRSYRAWYEATDALGEVHRGPVSIGTEVELADDESDYRVTLTLPTLRITKKQNVRIVVARTLDGDSSAFYRVTSSNPSTAGNANGYVANDPTVDTVEFRDEMSDAQLRGQEPAYTNGGILSNDPAPLGPVVAVGKSRLFFTDPGDGNVVRYSQPLDEGYGVEVPPELRIVCDPYGGSITALAAMDDTIIIFKQGAIFAFVGDGPLANGDVSQSGFSTPQLITSDVGCADPQSIVLTPAGLMFKSAKGIYLLDRSRSVAYVGAPVEAYNAQRVRRASLMTDRTQVVFLTDEGLTLLYDYFFGQWSTFTNHAGHDAAVVGGVYHYLRTDERVFREAPGVYSDAGRQIVLRLETAWIKLTDYLQGFARFWHALIIGERKSPHQLRVQFRTDYTSNWTEPVFLDATGAMQADEWVADWENGWTVGESGDTLLGTEYGAGNYGDGPYGGQSPDAYQWRVHLGTHGQAIQLRFEDYEQAGEAGASFELSEVLITGGIKNRARRPFSPNRSA